ncbi:MAG: recombinase family protein [Nanoarchaeota archaeon]|nr:recombinase family protein [Nanoarchaeota archaeon]
MSKCTKCGHDSEKNHKKNDFILCDVCFYFAPEENDELEQYLKEKVDGSLLKTFRRKENPAGKRQKRAMIKKASQGKLMSRAPFGYKIENKQLVPAENYREVEELFEEFLGTKISLTQLAKKHNFSVNGLKKILKNFTYIGKIKFNNQIHNGTHQPIISSTLFNHVQNKLEKLKIR